MDAAARNRRKSVPRRNTVNLYRSFLRFNYRIYWRLSARKFSFQVSNWFAISFLLGRDPTERVLSLDESIFNEINRNSRSSLVPAAILLVRISIQLRCQHVILTYKLEQPILLQSSFRNLTFDIFECHVYRLN